MDKMKAGTFIAEFIGEEDEIHELKKGKYQIEIKLARSLNRDIEIFLKCDAIPGPHMFTVYQTKEEFNKYWKIIEQ